MIKSTVCLILMCVAGYSFGQIGIGRIEGVKLRSGDFDEADLAALKATETIFICRDTDDPAFLETEFRKVWKYTPISVYRNSESQSMDLAGKSIFALAARVNTSQTINSQGSQVGATHVDMHCYLNLWMPGEKKKGKKSKVSFCRLEMFLDRNSETALYAKAYTDESLSEEMELDRLEVVYQYATIFNWHPGFLINYLRTVNDHLEKAETHWLFASEEDPEVAALKSAKLYVPDYVLTHLKRKGLINIEESRSDPVTLFRNYPYKYEVVTAEELSNKIIAGEEMFYYLVWVRSNTDTYVDVFNGKTGKLVYCSYDPMEMNLEDKNIKKLAAAVKQAAK